MRVKHEGQAWSAKAGLQSVRACFKLTPNKGDPHAITRRTAIPICPQSPHCRG